MLRIDLSKERGRTWVSSTGYYLTWVHNPPRGDSEDFYVLPASQFETNKSFLSDFAFQKMTTFIRDSRALFKNQNVNVHEYVYDVKSGLWTFK